MYLRCQSILSIARQCKKNGAQKAPFFVGSKAWLKL
jgi:hypothetical protein